ncbi:hypothetical protein E2C01_019578 [Portunus trituberculatus]|uniref:Uncharacterized protein n=1 Tax=Portunus trituberculatus TaxID=210409 RepID=A0A5B7DYA3_PORTR|nr:hypothetical protein [Portunus trituberculatus]
MKHTSAKLVWSKVWQKGISVGQKRRSGGKVDWANSRSNLLAVSPTNDNLADPTAVHDISMDSFSEADDSLRSSKCFEKDVNTD